MGQHSIVKTHIRAHRIEIMQRQCRKSANKCVFSPNIFLHLSILECAQFFRILFSILGFKIFSSCKNFNYQNKYIYIHVKIYVITIYNLEDSNINYCHDW